MILKEISNRIYYMPNTEATDRPTLGYVRGDSFSIMVDTGNSPKHLELFYEGLKERELPMPKIAVITHWHWDHTFAMKAFEGITIASRRTNDILKDVAKWTWTDEEMKNRLTSGTEIEFCDTYIRKEYTNLNDIEVVTADVIFENELSIDLGGIHCNLKLVGGPHSEDSAIVHIPEEEVLFVGDADCIDFYLKHETYDKDRLKAYVEKMNTLDFKTYIHGHCPPMTKDEIISQLKAELK
ncbi:MAG: MBL fold metallo-hydrolase [Proteocatella sp.]